MRQLLGKPCVLKPLHQSSSLLPTSKQEVKVSSTIIHSNNISVDKQEVACCSKTAAENPVALGPPSVFPTPIGYFSLLRQDGIILDQATTPRVGFSAGIAGAKHSRRLDRHRHST
jgi:hypothetical protein